MPTILDHLMRSVNAALAGIHQTEATRLRVILALASRQPTTAGALAPSSRT